MFSSCMCEGNINHTQEGILKYSWIDPYVNPYMLITVL